MSNSEGKEHEGLLELVYQDSNLDRESSYNFTIEALQAINSMINDFEGDERKPKGTKIEEYLEEPEIVQQFSQAPDYNSEKMDWIAKNYTFVDDIVEEFGNDVMDSGILEVAGMAYSKAWEEHFYKVLELVKG